MNIGGSGAQAQGETMITTSIIEQVAGAQRASRRRFSATFAATWLVLVGLIGAGMWIASGAEFDFVLTSGPVIVLQGAGTTVLVSALSIFFATMLALFGALARLSRTPVLNAIGSFYVSLFRGTPLLLQIYFMYFALPQLGIVLPAIAAGVTALSLNYGAYMTEIFRAGIVSVGHAQGEAADALGMMYRQKMRRVVLPQAFRVIIPPTGNEFIAMMKDSALVSFLGTQVAQMEIFRRAQLVGKASFRNLEALIVAAMIYWLLTTVFQYFQTRLEKRLSKGYVRGAATPAKRKTIPQSGGGLGGGAGTIEIPEPFEGGTALSPEEAAERAAQAMRDAAGPGRHDEDGP